MVKLGLAACVALLPAVIVWWQGRGLRTGLDSPTLAEAWWQHRVRAARYVATSGVVLTFLYGWMAFWLVPVVAIATLIAGFSARRAVLEEQWSVIAYLSWLARLMLVFAGTWVLLLLTPAIIASADPSSPWVFGACGLALAALLSMPHRWLVAMLGAREMAEHDQPQLQAFADEIAARSSASRPRLFRLDLVGGSWANALAIADIRCSAVVMSRSLLEILDLPERCAIYAHELAHLEHFNPRRLRRIAAAMWGLAALALAVTPVSRALTGDPWPGLLAWVLLLFAIVVWRTHRQQRNEGASDLRALELCGNAAALISALEKLHAASRMPRRLAVDEERRLSHPSLARRIQAIRDAAATDEATCEPPTHGGPTALEPTVAAVAGVGGRYVLLEAERISWLDGVPAAAAGHPATMRESARSIRSVPYAEISELRIGRRRNGRPELVVRELGQRRGSTALSEADAAVMQRGLDRVDGLLATATPPSLLARMGAATVVARVAAGLLVLNAMFLPGGGAVAVLALTAVILPRAGWLLAASTSALGGLLLARLSPEPSVIFATGSASTMHLIILMEALLLAALGMARAVAVDEDRSRWSWLPPALLSAGALATWGLFAAGSWLLEGDGLDLYRLHRWVHGSKLLLLFPVAAAVTALTTRRRRWLAALPLLLLPPALWVGGESFRNRYVHDPFIAKAPISQAKRSVAAKLLWEAELPAKASRFRLAPSGRRLAFSTSIPQQGTRTSRWTILEDGVEVDTVDAVDLGLAATDQLIVLVWADEELQLMNDADEPTWQMSLPALDVAELTIDGAAGLWAVHGNRESATGQELQRIAGSFGDRATSSTRIAVDDDVVWSGSVTWLGAEGVLQQGFTDFDEPDESTPWRQWFNGFRTRLVYRTPDQSTQLPSSRVMALQFAAAGLHDALCLATDDDRLHLWRISAEQPSRPAHVITLAGRYASLNVANARWLAIGALDRALLVDLSSSEAVELELGAEERHPTVVAIAGDALAVSRRSIDGHRIAVYQLP